MSNLVARIISALILIPIVLYCLYTGGLNTQLLLTVAIGAGMWEWASMFLPKERNTRYFVVILSAICAFLLMSSQSVSTGILVAFWTFALFFLSFLLPIGPKWEGFDSVCRAALGLFYIVLPMSSMAWLRTQGEIDFPLSGGDWIYLGLLCTWMDDTCAYFAGRAFGKHPFFPSVSPKKTWEGFFGGMVGAIGIALFCLYVLIPGMSWPFFAGLTYVDILWVGLPITILGPLGDLLESKIKREFNVKDSGTMIPGHGGMLDRLDALLLTLPWVLTYVEFIRPLIK